MYRNWRELIKPKRLEVDPEGHSRFYGKFVCEPLERGFGITLGNALRRVLISSLQGAAIVSVKFDGTLHEFSTFPGVVEDVTDIILNLKAVRLKMHGEEPRTIKLNANREGTVRAKDLICDPQVEVLNLDLPIATLSVDGRLKAEMTVKMGKGYVPSERNKVENVPVGTIFLDSAFSPIKKVTYVVGTARVGQITDYDKLTLEIWTDGSISPEDAVAIAAKILKEQLTPFINFEEEAEEPERPEVLHPEEQINQNLYKSVEELELSVRSANCLKNASIRHIWELVQRTEPEMLKTKNFGRKSLNEIKAILDEMGLHLGMKLDGFEFPLPEEKKENDNET
ncbi:MAG: DNA-directed RNA polymerase subunit alpha [Deltaproteobacteria bacterium RBG_13_43_22]|nr:MAG: DNA-directed RNA polymerase subunit alpha [Deltaproteobacteria bacterium RBG_13_43_22]